MNAAAITFLNRWWIRELINAVLRPMFVRSRTARRGGDEVKAERFQILLFRLLDACDCFPFCVEIDRCGLWILDEPSEQDDFWSEEGAA